MPKNSLNEADDLWLTERRWIIDPKKLHAIGWLTIQWTSCEDLLHGIFAVISKVPFEVGRAMTHKIGDVTLASMIANVSKVRALDTRIVENIKHLLTFYDICRKNRNILAHASLSHKSDEPTLVSATGIYAAPLLIDDSLESIRGAADDIDRLRHHLAAVCFMLIARQESSDWLFFWPDKPGFPRSVLKPLPAAPRPKRTEKPPKPDPPALPPQTPAGAWQ